MLSFCPITPSAPAWPVYSNHPGCICTSPALIDTLNTVPALHLPPALSVLGAACTPLHSIPFVLHTLCSPYVLFDALPVHGHRMSSLTLLLPGVTRGKPNPGATPRCYSETAVQFYTVTSAFEQRLAQKAIGRVACTTHALRCATYAAHAPCCMCRLHPCVAWGRRRCLRVVTGVGGQRVRTALGGYLHPTICFAALVSAPFFNATVLELPLDARPSLASSLPSLLSVCSPSLRVSCCTVLCVPADAPLCAA